MVTGITEFEFKKKTALGMVMKKGKLLPVNFTLISILSLNDRLVTVHNTEWPSKMHKLLTCKIMSKCVHFIGVLCICSKTPPPTSVHFATVL
jgi:hypothetical protein